MEAITEAITETITDIVENFQIADDESTQRPVIQISPIGNGLIHDTYLVDIANNDKSSRCIIQKMNNNVFPNIRELMNNIEKVSRHLQTKSLLSEKCCLVLIGTREGKLFWKGESSREYWRMYHYIPNSTSFSVSPSQRHLYEAGKAYGQFHRDMFDFSAALKETISDFHNTPKRLEDLRRAVANDSFRRVQTVQNEIQCTESNADIANLIFGMLSDGRIPRRVSHNDTKLDNVLFHKETGKAICVVDYDTIMPNGSILYDFGDSIRSISNTAREDEKDLDKVGFDLLSFQMFTEGFLNGLETTITKNEKQMLPKGALVITFEQTIRFLTDYLMGDVYFKTLYPEHNLDRTRNQLKLFEIMKTREKEMIDMVLEIG